MNPRMIAFRAGMQRGWIEFRQIMTDPGQVLGWMFFPVIGLIVMYVLRDNTVPGTNFSLGSQAIPGILAMNIMFTGLTGLAMALTMDREDGTLLRAKATPNGMLGYLTGKVFAQAGMTTVLVFILLAPAGLLFNGLRLGSGSSWLTLGWVLLLGLLATLPIGALLGSLFRSAQSLGYVTLLITGLVLISGVFYPITGLPEWLQWVAQIFPIYWLGLGLRSAMLPDPLSAVEIGESWRHLEMLGVLGTWVIIGFVVAPLVLRRMARRESGSSVTDRLENVRQRPT